MHHQTYPPVIRLASLEDFQALIPARSTVYLFLGTHPGSAYTFNLSLTLSAINRTGSIVTLTTSRILESIDGRTPVSPKGAAILNAMRTAKSLLHAHLRSLKYRVLEGQVAVPQDLRDLIVTLDCLEFTTQPDGTIEVILNAPRQSSPIATLHRLFHRLTKQPG